MAAPRTRARSRRTALTLVLLILATAPSPSVAATPDPAGWIGVGANDVREEPNHRLDANGFPHVGFTPGSPTLVLDAYHHTPGLGDPNQVLNVVLHGTDHGAYEATILPGVGTFRAWWGWWHDTGSAGALQEDQVRTDDALGITAPDVALPTSPNGAIDDAHDADGATWDELVWRGRNPWAPDHDLCDSDADGVTDPRCAEDNLLLFLQPGTHARMDHQVLRGAALGQRADAGDVPDQAFHDRTSRRPEHGVREGQGWFAGGGLPFLATDASLLTTTVSTVSVDPEHAHGDEYDPHEADAVDVDTYSALHPDVEALYRTAVWDPGNEADGPLDPVHDAGVKGAAKDLWAAYGVTLEDDATETALHSPATAPLILPIATADDLDRPPWAHEPNHPSDDYDGHATYDPATRYGGDPYYDPGPNQGYGGYAGDGEPWLDVQARFGVPAYAGAGHAMLAWNHRPAPGGPGSPGAYPSVLTAYGHGGVWWDANEDDFVGDLDEHGRFTSSPHPYARGLVEDPNDYTDHAAATRNDPQKTRPAEWRGLCHGNANLHVEVEPTRDFDGDGDGHWGAAGAYVVHDGEGGSNPYDDAAVDAVGGFQLDTDAGASVHLEDRRDPGGRDGQLSRYVTEGPVELPMTCDAGDPDGAWTSTAHVLLPLGTLGGSLEVRSTFTIVGAVASPWFGESLRGSIVLDVDEVAAWTSPG